MEMIVRDGHQMVEIWLTNAEKKDSELRASLKTIYHFFKKKNYLVAVYESGEKNLCENVSALLIYNKRRSAEMEVAARISAGMIHRQKRDLQRKT